MDKTPDQFGAPPANKTSPRSNFLLQLRHDLEQIANKTEVGDLKDRRFSVLVDRHDGAGVLDTGQALDELDPMSEDYIDKLSHIRGAVSHHMYEEEHTWFRKLQDKACAETMERLTRLYAESFDRYVGGDTSTSVIKAYKTQMH